MLTGDEDDGDPPDDEEWPGLDCDPGECDDDEY